MATELQKARDKVLGERSQRDSSFNEDVKMWIVLATERMELTSAAVDEALRKARYSNTLLRPIN